MPMVTVKILGMLNCAEKVNRIRRHSTSLAHREDVPEEHTVCGSRGPISICETIFKVEDPTEDPALRITKIGWR